MKEYWEVIKINGLYYWQEFYSQRLILGCQDLREHLFYEADHGNL